MVHTVFPLRPGVEPKRSKSARLIPGLLRVPELHMALPNHSCFTVNVPKVGHLLIGGAREPSVVSQPFYYALRGIVTGPS